MIGCFADFLSEGMPSDETAWWEEAARRAIKYFPDKKAYLRWVYSTYGGSDNRFTADVCWDIIKLSELSEEGNGET